MRQKAGSETPLTPHEALPYLARAEERLTNRSEVTLQELQRRVHHPN